MASQKQERSAKNTAGQTRAFQTFITRQQKDKHIEKHVGENPCSVFGERASPKHHSPTVFNKIMLAFFGGKPNARRAYRVLKRWLWVAFPQPNQKKGKGQKHVISLFRRVASSAIIISHLVRYLRSRG
jgi:hypothetical protein